MSKILIINSSFRKKSNSSTLSEHIAKGAKTAGHEVQTKDIARLQINPCRGCAGCWQPATDFCVVKDDMLPLYPLVQQADVLILAAPIYWFNMGGQLKQFIDRLYAVGINPDYAPPSPFAAKKIGGVFTFGAVDSFMAGAVNAIRSLQDVCQYSGATWAGALYGSAQTPGEIANNVELLRQAREYGANL